MATSPKIPASLVSELLALATELGPTAVKLLLQLFRAIRGAPDPVAALKRALKAAGAKTALNETLKRTLGRSKR